MDSFSGTDASAKQLNATPAEEKHILEVDERQAAAGQVIQKTFDQHQQLQKAHEHQGAIGRAVEGADNGLNYHNSYNNTNKRIIQSETDANNLIWQIPNGGDGFNSGYKKVSGNNYDPNNPLLKDDQWGGEVADNAKSIKGYEKNQKIGTIVFGMFLAPGGYASGGATANAWEDNTRSDGTHDFSAKDYLKTIGIAAAGFIGGALPFGEAFSAAGSFLSGIFRGAGDAGEVIGGVTRGASEFGEGASHTPPSILPPRGSSDVPPGNVPPRGTGEAPPSSNGNVPPRSGNTPPAGDTPPPPRMETPPPPRDEVPPNGNGAEPPPPPNPARADVTPMPSPGQQTAYDNAMTQIFNSADPRRAFRLWGLRGGHPDRGGDTAVFQQISDNLDRYTANPQAFEHFNPEFTFGRGNGASSAETPPPTRTETPPPTRNETTPPPEPTREPTPEPTPEPNSSSTFDTGNGNTGAEVPPPPRGEAPGPTGAEPPPQSNFFNFPPRGNNFFNSGNPFNNFGERTSNFFGGFGNSFDGFGGRASNFFGSRFSGFGFSGFRQSWENIQRNFGRMFGNLSDNLPNFGASGFRQSWENIQRNFGRFFGSRGSEAPPREEVPPTSADTPPPHTEMPPPREEAPPSGNGTQPPPPRTETPPPREEVPPSGNGNVPPRSDFEPVSVRELNDPQRTTFFNAMRQIVTDIDSGRNMTIAWGRQARQFRVGPNNPNGDGAVERALNDVTQAWRNGDLTPEQQGNFLNYFRNFGEARPNMNVPPRGNTTPPGPEPTRPTPEPEPTPEPDPAPADSGNANFHETNVPPTAHEEVPPQPAPQGPTVPQPNPANLNFDIHTLGNVGATEYQGVRDILQQNPQLLRGIVVTDRQGGQTEFSFVTGQDSDVHSFFMPSNRVPDYVFNNPDTLSQWLNLGEHFPPHARIDMNGETLRPGFDIPEEPIPNPTHANETPLASQEPAVQQPVPPETHVPAETPPTADAEVGFGADVPQLQTELDNARNFVAYRAAHFEDAEVAQEYGDTFGEIFTAFDPRGNEIINPNYEREFAEWAAQNNPPVGPRGLEIYDAMVDSLNQVRQLTGSTRGQEPHFEFLPGYRE